MLRRTLTLVVACFLVGARPVSAQRTFESLGDDFGHAATDVWHVWTSPFRMDGRDALTVLGVAGGYALATTIDMPVQRWVRGHRSGDAFDVLKPFEGDRIDALGKTYYMAPFMGALYVTGFAFDSRPLRDAAMGCLSADLANSAVREGIYKLVARERPTNIATGDVQQSAYHYSVPGKAWNYHSFPGGHVSNVMGCASFLNHRFDMGVAGPLVYLAAVGVGVARTVNEEHWTSDTLIGMLFGYAVGYEIAKQYQRRQEDAEGPVASLSGPDASGFHIGWTWRF